MHTFVIVHGAWDGGWFWRPVADQLCALGHRAYAVTLTGLGERAHLARNRVDLDVHIQDVVNVIEFEDLERVCLVGHSYGGVVVTGVADRIPRRLVQVIYVDAFVPCDGQALVDLAPPQVRSLMTAAATTCLPDGRLPFPGEPFDRRVRPHPVATFTQPLRLTSPDLHGTPRAFIHCTSKGEPVPVMYAGVEDAARRARDEGWRYATLPTGHNPNWTMPGETAALIERLADGR